MSIETVQPDPSNGLAPSAVVEPVPDSSGAEKLTDAERARRWQSSATKTANELRELRERVGPLAETLKSVDGTIVSRAIEEYQLLANDPAVSAALRAYRETGQFSLAPPPPPAEEPFLTDTERRLQQELAETRSQVTSLTQNFGAQSFAQHAEHVFGELGLTGELAEKTKTAIAAQVSQWASQGEQGRRALLDLQSPQGRKTVETLVSSALGAKGMLELAKQQLQRQGTTRAGMATDGPSTFGTTGDEPAPEAKSVLEALKTVRARPELLSRYG